jgi:hypothetical protein
LEQCFVDASQPRHSEAGAELVEHAHIGHALLVGQAGEAAPSALFG